MSKHVGLEPTSERCWAVCSSNPCIVSDLALVWLYCDPSQRGKAPRIDQEQWSMNGSTGVPHLKENTLP